MSFAWWNQDTFSVRLFDCLIFFGVKIPKTDVKSINDIINRLKAINESFDLN